SLRAAVSLDAWRSLPGGIPSLPPTRTGRCPGGAAYSRVHGAKTGTAGDHGRSTSVPDRLQATREPFSVLYPLLRSHEAGRSLSALAVARRLGQTDRTGVSGRGG